MDDLSDFEKLVRAMRHFQRQYFKARTNDMLEKSKQLEKEVDAYLAAKEAAIKQPSLF